MPLNVRRKVCRERAVVREPEGLVARYGISDRADICVRTLVHRKSPYLGVQIPSQQGLAAIHSPTFVSCELRLASQDRRKGWCH